MKDLWILPFPFLRAEVCLFVCRRRDEKLSDTEGVYCAVKVELLFWTSEHSLGEETEIAQMNHFTGRTGENKIQLRFSAGEFVL